MKLPRRKFLRLAAGAVALPLVSQIASAQAFPTRPVRMIVPAAAGGPGDVIGRLMARKLSETWGKPFVVENIPTGSGNVAVGMVAKALPDGHTLLVASTSFVNNSGLYIR